VIITLASGKGGVGKTTGALAIAALLAKRYRVSLVDFDPESYATGMGLNLETFPKPDPLHAAPEQYIDLEVAGGSLCVFAGGPEIDDASDSDIEAHIARAADISDIVVVDTPPDRRRPAVTTALRLASVLVIPITPEFQSISGMEKLLETSRSVGSRAVPRALLSRWEPRTNLARDVQRELVSRHPGLAVSVAIPRDQRAAEAPASARPVTLLAPRCAAAEAYRTATYEIAASAGLLIPRGGL
jgi:chromosome partitioning protein